MGEEQQICVTGPFIPDKPCSQEITQYICGTNPDACEFTGITLSIQPNSKNYVNIYSKDYIESIKDISGFGTPTTLSSLYADACIYRPGLLSRDVWKWDLSGESDYGLIEPPINEPNYDLFDSNWSAQFIVYSKGDSSIISCATLGLGRCSHSATAPRGATYDPYVNCISKNYPKDPGASGASGASGGSPDDKEPTYVELNELYIKTKECDLLKSLNPAYLGCMYDDPSNECSCDCPNQGSKFHEYLACTKSDATFWQTPHKTPIFRKAQMAQLMSESIQITISGFLSAPLKLGQIIEIRNSSGLYDNKPRKSDGPWMVSTITYNFIGDNHYSMNVTLNRDTLGDTYVSGKSNNPLPFSIGNSDSGQVISGSESKYWTTR